MLITKVTRSYSRSINAKNYNVPESWIRVEATYEATVETGDDPVKISNMLYDQAKTEVVENVNEIITKMKAASQGLQNVASAGTGGAVAPVATTAGVAPRPLS